MGKHLKYTKYTLDSEFSYIFGAFPTMEAISFAPSLVRAVFVHSDFLSAPSYEEFSKLCDNYKIEFSIADKQVERLRDKGKCLVIGVFEKHQSELSTQAHHLVLVNPMDMGNMGTILRTALGFGFRDIALIKPCCDVFNPKVVRSSMGALFKLRIRSFESFDDYLEFCSEPEREYHPFMLGAVEDLSTLSFKSALPKSLIFGNESSGLDESYVNIGVPCIIRHEATIDSLNLAVAVSIALYDFYCKNS